MRSHDLALALFLLSLVVVPVSATYAADHPLTPVYAETVHGGYLYTLGNSTYSGTLEPGATYAVAYEDLLPEGAEVGFARLYFYWAWSKDGQAAVYPAVDIAADGTPLERVARYTDSKGFVSKNDFFSGVDVYALPDLAPGRPLTVTGTNAAEGNATFVVQGAAVLLVCEDPAASEKMLWVQEGADLLYSNYGITPKMATAQTTFDGEIDTGRVKSATLFLAAPSAGYTAADLPEKNRIAMNRGGESGLPSFIQSIIDLVFPSANGKTWIDAFDADEERQVGTDRRDVTPWLRSSGNTVEVQDRGDYLQFTNAVLEVELR